MAPLPLRSGRFRRKEISCTYGKACRRKYNLLDFAKGGAADFRPPVVRGLYGQPLPQSVVLETLLLPSLHGHFIKRKAKNTAFSFDATCMGKVGFFLFFSCWGRMFHRHQMTSLLSMGLLGHFVKRGKAPGLLIRDPLRLLQLGLPELLHSLLIFSPNGSFSLLICVHVRYILRTRE